MTWTNLRETGVLDWSAAPHLILVSSVAALLAAYFLTLRTLQQQRGAQPTDRRKALWFTTGMAALYIAEAPPLHVVSERYLFSAHMIQHSLITLVFPACIILGLPPSLLRRPLRFKPVFAGASVLTRPVMAFLLFNFTYSVWHIPRLYEAALEHHWLHMVEHIAFLFAAFLMWWPLLSPLPELPRLGEPGRLLYLFLLIVAQLAVAGPLIFLSEPAYGFYVRAPRLWNIPPLLDQQLAGILMKLPAMAVFLSVFSVVFIRWSHQEKD